LFGMYGPEPRFKATGNLNKFFCNMNNPDKDENKWSEGKEQSRDVEGITSASWIFLPTQNYGLLNWSW